MSSSLVISLDFELMWGVRDHRSIKDYGESVLGGRRAIPLILERFRKAGIRATWATVGLLFAGNRHEMLEYAPQCRPVYDNPRLSPYFDIEAKNIGENESEDQFHYGGSLISRISDTCGQEIATHTYSHFYCMERGATEDSFEHDLKSAQSISSKYGHKIQSIVFPRNQTKDRFIKIGRNVGINTYRGDANGWLYQARSSKRTNSFMRLARFLDGALPIGAAQIVQPSTEPLLTNVPASRFLRPWTRNMSAYNQLHLRRIQSEMLMAARTGGCYHLWWHPHNFGLEVERNLHQLDKVIEHFKLCRDKFGMISRNMSDFSVKYSSSP